MVLSHIYCDALGRDTLDPWLISTLVLGELHDTHGVVTQRTQKEKICGKLENDAHKRLSELWDVGYKHECPFTR